MSRRPAGPRARRVAMAVANDIVQDARVRKTAESLGAAGYDVTLIHARTNPRGPGTGTLGTVSTVGLVVPYTLRDALGEGWHVRSARLPGSYAHEHERDLDRESVLLEQMRAAPRDRRARLRLRARAAWVQARLRIDAWQQSRSPRPDSPGPGAGAGPSDWRAALPNVGDLTLSFTKRLWRLEPDVVHVHDIHLLEAGVLAVARMRAAGRDVRLVYDAHEFVPGMSTRSAQDAAAYAALEAELIGRADAVVTVSEPIADALAERYGLRRRPVVTLNTPRAADVARGAGGAELTAGAGHAADTAPDVRAAAGVAEGVDLLVYSGVLNPRRGVLTAVEALAHLPEVHLAVVCVPDARTAATGPLRARAQELGVEDRLHLVDPVPTEQITTYLRTADVGVHPMVGGLPNHEMALPNKIFDYLHAGLPIVVSGVRAMAELVGTLGIGGVFRAQDAADLARAAREVLDDRAAVRARVGAPGVLDVYTWERQEQHLLGLYEELAPLHR